MKSSLSYYRLRIKQNQKAESAAHIIAILYITTCNVSAMCNNPLFTINSLSVKSEY